MRIASTTCCVLGSVLLGNAQVRPSIWEAQLLLAHLRLLAQAISLVPNGHFALAFTQALCSQSRCTVDCVYFVHLRCFLLFLFLFSLSYAYITTLLTYPSFYHNIITSIPTDSLRRAFNTSLRSSVIKAYDAYTLSFLWACSSHRQLHNHHLCLSLNSPIRLRKLRPDQTHHSRRLVPRHHRRQLCID